MAGTTAGPRVRRLRRRRSQALRWVLVASVAALVLAWAVLVRPGRSDSGDDPAPAIPVPAGPAAPDPASVAGPGTGGSADDAALSPSSPLGEALAEHRLQVTRRPPRPRPRRSPAPDPRPVLAGVDPEPAWTATTGLDAEGKPLHVLVLGTDDEGYRSDVIMLVRIEPATGRVAVLNLPRDTLSPIAGTGRYPRQDKLGHASAYRDAEYNGPERARASVQQLLGVRVHRWAVVDLTAFVTLVDAVGGVDFEVPFDMVYDDPWQNLHINLQAGMQHLDGTQAMHLVRWRHDNSGKGYGDLGRIRTQRALMLAILEQVKANAGAVLMEAPELARKVRTNLKIPSEATALALLATRVEANQVEWLTLPGHGGDPGTPDFGYYLTSAAEIDEGVRLWRGD